ncbi:LIC_10190 family membrane protein [Flavobacterium sp.]|uniref:LIC_10190 family membrane protein n=1 Tax=Flavobacterium sp. TaxID=239 RepID=UPI003BE04994
MLFIILSWIYILITTIHLGYFLEKLIRLNNKDFVTTSVLGLFSATILASIWAIFGRINIEFHVFLLILNFFIFLRHKWNILEIYKIFITDFRNLTYSLKIYLIGIIILIIAQCAAKPFVIDNESYYIQTIKWINEYGFVKGLANLHIFFGQTSGWHITQSVFNFSFLYADFNDLSGFCLMLGSIFAVFKLNSYFDSGIKINLIIGLLPIANVLLFQFISAPSPDLPVYVISFMIFFYFINHYNKPSINKFNLLVILVLFVVYIKPTAIAMLFIPMLFFITNFKLLKFNLLTSSLLSVIVLSLFIIKNTIITGYPLYPTQLFSGTNFDFKVPKALISFYFDETKLYGFYSSQAEFNSMNQFQILIKWLTFNTINSIFNILNVLLVFISTYFIYKYFNQKKYWLLYFVMVFQFGLLLFTSPQFRFFIQFLLFFSLLIIVCFLNSKRSILILLFGSSVIVIILVLVPINYSTLTKNKLITENSHFTILEIVFPHPNSKLSTHFYKHKIGNLEYNSPDKNSYFWTNSNGKLPCVNSQQINYFKANYHFIPQMRTLDLKDGFYSKKVSSNE